MSDWIGLGVIVALILGGLYGISLLNRPYDVTPDEFERRADEGRGSTRAGAAAGLHALQKLMNPKAAEAIEVIKDLRAGHYDIKEEVGEGDDEEEDVNKTTAHPTVDEATAHPINQEEEDA
ncbi:MAG TPA: hypothetical protein VNA19_10925 [Pyrinomonadaceae bacterium]|jgi:hypothetical protein|nr:hypothetical protein [Pyrinomonadaceae bacterium]